MMAYMGRGLKLPQLACERHPALPNPPFLGGVMAMVYPHGSAYTERTRWIYETEGSICQGAEGCLPERLCLSLPSPNKCPSFAHTSSFEVQKAPQPIDCGACLMD